MMITDAVRAVLSRPMKEEPIDIIGEAISFSTLENDSCITRVFRGEKGQAEKRANQWIQLAQKECKGILSDIAVSVLRIPAKGGESSQENVIVAITADGIMLNEEPKGRKITTESGLNLTERKSGTSVAAIWRDNEMGTMVGEIQATQDGWVVHATMWRTRRPTQKSGILRDNQLFRSLRAAATALDDDLSGEKEKFETERRENMTIRKRVRNEINDMFGKPDSG